MKVYVVLSSYSDYEGGGDHIQGIFSDFEKAESFIIKEIELDATRDYREGRGWKDFVRNSVDEWSYPFQSDSTIYNGAKIEEIEVT